MSRVLVFGADGLIGHYLIANLSEHAEIMGTLHGIPDNGAAFPPTVRQAYGIDAADTPSISKLLDSFRPDWVINAIGLVKRPRAADPIASLEANTLFPHRLAALCGQRGIRLLHFSTDCVFSGKHGNYCETDFPDNPDWHGRCKAIGEPSGENVLVFRTSFIGLELACRKSLVEWFLTQRGDIPGYTHAIWSGLTAAEVARLATRLVNCPTPPSGLWHLAASRPISKFELLSALNERLGERGCRVIPDDSFVCDRSLDGSAFRQAFSYTPPDICLQLDELAAEILSSGRLSDRL